MDELATIEAGNDRLQQVIRETSIAVEDGTTIYPIVRLSVTADGLESTTPTVGSGPSFDARYDPSFFTSYEPARSPFLAALGTEATLRWLDWFDSDSLTVAFSGDATAGVARAVELRDDDDRVEIGPLPTDTVDPDLTSGRPDGFDGDEFVHGGTPAPTRIQTSGETLARLAEAADIVDDGGTPVVVSDGQFRLSVAGDLMHGEGTLSATVRGPDCENRYGDGFAAIARTLTGPVTLQVVPSGPMAVTQVGDGATRRYVLTQSM